MLDSCDSCLLEASYYLNWNQGWHWNSDCYSSTEARLVFLKCSWEFLPIAKSCTKPGVEVISSPIVTLSQTYQPPLSLQLLAPTVALYKKQLQSIMTRSRGFLPIANSCTKHGAEAYILKADVLDVRTPQKIQIFRRKIVWERENYQSQSLKPNNSAMCYK